MFLRSFWPLPFLIVGKNGPAGPKWDLSYIVPYFLKDPTKYLGRDEAQTGPWHGHGTTKTGYGTTEAGCRGGSRYVEGDSKI